MCTIIILVTKLFKLFASAFLYGIMQPLQGVLNAWFF